jgi:hypothetical protein
MTLFAEKTCLTIDNPGCMHESFFSSRSGCGTHFYFEQEMTMNRRKLKTTALLAAAYAFACTGVFATTHEDKGKAAATQSDSAPKDQTDGSTVAVGVPETVMVPMEFKVEPQAKGCWVELYTKEGFRGDRLTLVGPLDMPKMRGPFGAQWENEVESIKTGPKATVTIFDNDNFAQRSEKVGPNQEIPELGNRMELFDNFRSMQVAC